MAHDKLNLRLPVPYIPSYRTPCDKKSIQPLNEHTPFSSLCDDPTRGSSKSRSGGVPTPVVVS